MKKIGFIGAGNMGGALLGKVLENPMVCPTDVYVCDLDTTKTATFQEKFGCCSTDSATIAAECGYIFLAVKPQYMEGMLAEIRPVLASRGADTPVLVTIAAGLTMENIRQMAGGSFPVIRIMPNTPASVGMGLLMWDSADVSEMDAKTVCAVLAGAGKMDHLPERLIDAGTAVSGCGPAFFCLLLEAMADGGVSCGLPRDKAMEYAAQTMLGTAKMVLETGKHPGVLKDEVTSPGGSTIAGVRELECAGVRSAMMEAVIAAYERNLTFRK